MPPQPGASGTDTGGLEGLEKSEIAFILFLMAAIALLTAAQLIVHMVTGLTRSGN